MPGRRAIVVVLVAFAVVFVTLEITSYTQKSAVWDEPIHVADGYTSLAQHDYRVDPEHPPFLRMWAALPLVTMGVTPFDRAAIERTAPTNWARSLFAYCERFLYIQNDGDRLLYAARFMIVLLGVGLGVLLFAWAKEWLGFWPAVVALACYTLEPNIAANAALVTTDFGLACFMFGAVYFLWRTCRQPAWPNIAGAVAFFALAVISKFSAIVLVLAAPMLVAFAVMRRGALSLRAGASLLVLLLTTGWVAIWAIYGFRYAPSASPAWLYDFQPDAQVQASVPGLASLVTWIDHHHLVPNAFSQGFLFGQAKSIGRDAFLAGTITKTGWWYYFPAAFVLKTPIALLVLMAGGVGLAAARWRQLDVDTVVFASLPVVLFMGSAMTTRLNIGVRHILPIYPFLLLFVALAAREAIAMRTKAATYALAGLVVLTGVEFARAYPDNLAFFNVLAGGPDHGSEYLVDSNVDWGQDLKPLKKWMDENGVAHINLAYFGTAFPPYYKMDVTTLPGSAYFQPSQNLNVPLPGYVAISATLLRGVYLSDEQRAFYRPFQHMTPVTTIGHSIFVFWVDRPWW